MKWISINDMENLPLVSKDYIVLIKTTLGPRINTAVYCSSYWHIISNPMYFPCEITHFADPYPLPPDNAECEMDNCF
jgi:hypothetical protein